MEAPNYQPTIKEKEFEKYHEKLRNELNIANWHFTICKYLKNIGKDYLRELNQAPAFFSLTKNAHLLETIMRINRFFDKDRRKRPLTIWEFLDFVQQNLDMFSSEAFEKRVRDRGRYDEIAMRRRIEITCQKVVQDRQKLQRLPIHNLRKWRNRALAHTQKKDVLQNIDVFKEYPVEPQQIDEIIDTLHDVLNDYSAAYDASSRFKGLGGA